MKPSEELIEAMKTLGYREKNPKMWYKFVGPDKYGINLSGKTPAPFVFRDDEQMFDQTDPEIQKIMAAIAESKTAGYEPKKPRKEPTNEDVDTGTADSAVCELCNMSMDNTDAVPVGYPMTHSVCETCSKKITSNEINVDVWYPKNTFVSNGEEDEENKTTEPDDNIAETSVTETNEIGNSIINFPLQLGEMGKIKIGKKGENKTSKSGTTFKMPVKLDHFIVTTTEKDKETDQFILDERIMDELGENCVSIKVTVPYNDIGLVIPTSYTRYESAKCMCRGNGNNAKLDTGQMVPCNPDTCPHFINKKCKHNAVLSVMLNSASFVGGVHKFRTTSFNSIRNILTSLTFLKTRTHGVLAGLPLVLTLQPKTVNIPDGRGTTVIYMVNLVFDGTMAELNETAMEIARQNTGIEEMARLETAATEQLLLPESEEEQRDVCEEFFPDER